MSQNKEGAKHPDLEACIGVGCAIREKCIRYYVIVTKTTQFVRKDCVIGCTHFIRTAKPQHFLTGIAYVHK